MNQIVKFNPSQVPAFAKTGEMSALAKALAGGSGQNGKRISIKGGVFRLFSEGKEVAAIEDRFLDVVIVNAAPKVSRTFYAGQYVDGQATAPTCWSQDGDVPDPTCKTKQAGSCATCNQNVKGSGQGDSRACRYSQRIAVVLANDMEGSVMQVSLAATSIFGKPEGENHPLQSFTRTLLAQGVDPAKLVTQMRFDTKAPVPKLFFKPVRWLSEEEYAGCAVKGASPEAISAIMMTVSQQDAPAVAAPAPMSIPGKPPKAAKAAPAPEPEGEEEPAEPTVRAAAPAKNAVPAGSKLASTLAQWDDEE